MNDPKYDGEFDKPTQHGPAVPSIDEVTRATITELTYWQKVGNFKALQRGSTVRNVPGVLIEEPPGRIVGADVLEWRRIFAEVPANRKEWEPWVYNYQWIVDGTVSEAAFPVSSYVIYSYVHTTDPGNVPLAQAFRITGDIYVGTLPTFNTWILAEDLQIRRWRGDIWESAARYIFYRNFFKR